MLHICSNTVTDVVKMLIYLVFSWRGILIRSGNRPPSSLFGEVRTTFPRLHLCLVSLRICNLRVPQGDLHKKDEYEFYDEV